jgi:hypothetical protein
MQKVPETTPSRKPSKAYYAHLYDQAGVLAQVHGTIYFLASDSGAITAIAPAMCPFLTVLGEIGLADTQALMDHLRGGYARIATSQPN